MLLGDNNGVNKSTGRRRASMVEHKTLEKYLGRYSGLILFLKEMDEAVYAKLCAVCGLLSFYVPNADFVMETGVFLCGERTTQYPDAGIIRYICRICQKAFGGRFSR